MHNHGPCLGMQTLTLSTTAASALTIPGNPAYANAALIRMESSSGRFRMDGTIATTGSTGGFPIYASDTSPFWIEPSQGGLINFSAIALSGTPVLQIMYFGVGQK